MASQHVSLEELKCALCGKISRSPVTLSCGHSFCEKCIQRFWRITGTQECPLCRRRSSIEIPSPNMRTERRGLLEDRDESHSSGSEEICSLHREKLKLFCLEDKQPVCVVCRDSQKHANHTFRPISEIGRSYKNINEKKTILIKDGNPARYRLQTKTDNIGQSELYRKMTFGERDLMKPHKTILMMGETGTGKTTLINAMINYMLGVKREGKVWFEITDDQSDRISAHSQTSSITVYGFYPQESPIHLTIIDTPGIGNTRGVENDKQIAESFLSLSESAKEVHEIHAVCLVIKATQDQLSARLIYIFDAVQSLFGSDIDENIVLLFTHSDGAQPNYALTTLKVAKVKYAVNYVNQPVFFLFDNCQSKPADKDETILEQSWNLSFIGMAGLFKFLYTIKPKTLRMTQYVLQRRKQLEANISNLKARVQMTELKKNELKQTQEALEKHEKDVKDKNNFEYEVDVPYKEKDDIDPSVASEAICCSVCEENCHYPGCWWARDPSRCSVMKDDHCTVCAKKCHYSKHVKEAKIYVTKTKKEKRTYEDLKKKYDDKLIDDLSVLKKLEEELQELEKEKEKLVNEAFHCVQTLEMIALNTDSVFTLLHIDFLIEKLEEINESEKAEILENIKKRAGVGKGAHAL